VVTESSLQTKFALSETHLKTSKPTSQWQTPWPTNSRQLSWGWYEKFQEFEQKLTGVSDANGSEDWRKNLKLPAKDTRQQTEVRKRLQRLVCQG
jgi:hypothetical protein